ncbi:endonuclease [Vibrio sp. D431a]|uniref:endonuclease n=1 Tax=Vibrio sp. D431a TaxID=2837388 RepID=UPI0025553C12
MKKISLITIAVSTAIASFGSLANQNENITSFNKAKKLLLSEVYSITGKTTVYCHGSFTDNKTFIAPKGFESSKYPKRQKRIEFEHITAAENFGRAIVPNEWNNGHPKCVTSSGKQYKGRRCAAKVSDEYKRAEADMHNLYAANGAVNALRSNYNFVMLPSSKSSFGSCDMRIEGSKAQPPELARGVIARAHMYMEYAYPRFKMSSSQSKLMKAWDKQYPVTAEECSRYKIIDKIQGSKNIILASRCTS